MEVEDNGRNAMRYSLDSGRSWMCQGRDKTGRPVTQNRRPDLEWRRRAKCKARPSRPPSSRNRRLSELAGGTSAASTLSGAGFEEFCCAPAARLGEPLHSVCSLLTLTIQPCATRSQRPAASYLRAFVPFLRQVGWAVKVPSYLCREQAWMYFTWE